MLSCTRSASSVRLSRPSCCSSARILRSMASMWRILPRARRGGVELGSGFHALLPRFVPMDVQLLIACSVMMTLMVILPGPDWAFLIAAGTRERTILPSLAGILLGYLATVAAVAIGVGAAVAAVPWIIVGLTFAAATYLTYLGVRVLREPPVVAAVAGGSGGAPVAT
ncbi:hypothetical protein ESO86_07665, partial [Agromyces binzhouensis]